MTEKDHIFLFSRVQVRLEGMLSAPPSLATDTLQSALEALANELMVDIELDRVDAG